MSARFSETPTVGTVDLASLSANMSASLGL